MENYKNLNNTSGVLRYGIGPNHITVEFKAGLKRFYKYTSASAGLLHLDALKQLAQKGAGLNSYINLHVKKRYESCW